MSSKTRRTGQRGPEFIFLDYPENEIYLLLLESFSRFSSFTEIISSMYVKQNRKSIRTTYTLTELNHPWCGDRRRVRRRRKNSQHPDRDNGSDKFVLIMNPYETSREREIKTEFKSSSENKTKIVWGRRVFVVVEARNSYCIPPTVAYQSVAKFKRVFHSLLLHHQLKKWKDAARVQVVLLLLLLLL